MHVPRSSNTSLEILKHTSVFSPSGPQLNHLPFYSTTRQNCPFTAIECTHLAHIHIPEAFFLKKIPATCHIVNPTWQVECMETKGEKNLIKEIKKDMLHSKLTKWDPIRIAATPAMTMVESFAVDVVVVVFCLKKKHHKKIESTSDHTRTVYVVGFWQWIGSTDR